MKHAFFVIVAMSLTACFLFAQSMNQPAELRQPHIIIKKNARILEVFDGAKLVRSYKIALGFAPVGDKEIEGDGKTPEGEFYVFTKNPKSRFHLSLGLSYPSKPGAKRGLNAKLITDEEFESINTAIETCGMPPQKTRLGGEIYIHGGGTDRDWTDGCIALKNEEVTELFDLISKGARVLIVP
jgi:murein L,D-transpeptidase YafK